MATVYSQQPANVVYMPQQPQNQGTLTPGQTITLKQHTVTVERYLSQGGFAHVYLVRTPHPVNGTTQHVLKRMAVSDDVMLQEVKKEVDVMKVLRGHPNIVNLIDAASFAQPNGSHEVFILMEYCAGGGIIDMMNRRLRERLTESEILQIFVDVCEGVACMHNLKPALLHRDLKVENILQAGEKSFKLCDFGSAATAAVKPPSTTAELKALENDLNRHTTLQYRAPEMVDPYLRRPVDEKSDVWALGVLLYKLCYYTTPFEEHGPLAILHVNYKIPAYPVYSSNMTMLITSMLQELGTARPTVFQLLDNVHRLRGTRSNFSYRHRQRHNLDIPMPRPVSNQQATGTATARPAYRLQAAASSPSLDTSSNSKTTAAPPGSNSSSSSRHHHHSRHPPPLPISLAQQSAPSSGPSTPTTAGSTAPQQPPRLENMYSTQSNPYVVVLQTPQTSTPTQTPPASASTSRRPSPPGAQVPLRSATVDGSGQAQGQKTQTQGQPQRKGSLMMNMIPPRIPPPQPHPRGMSLDSLHSTRHHPHRHHHVGSQPTFFPVVAPPQQMHNGYPRYHPMQPPQGGPVRTDSANSAGAPSQTRGGTTTPGSKGRPTPIRQESSSGVRGVLRKDPPQPRPGQPVRSNTAPFPAGLPMFGPPPPMVAPQPSRMRSLWPLGV
ncbi:hypothetical protein FRB95_007458 [Tulasnella sp. JGI-2019a]|nr:hypothetical protein FRB95_007458 [Tulasnella sp. JGI-2019a]